MTQDDIWDDSALVNSWNEALVEYKKYHSIHATGGNVDDLLSSQNEQRAKPETRPGHGVDSASPPKGDEAINGSSPSGAATTKDRVDATAREAQPQSQDTRDVTPAGGASVLPSPEALLGSVQDEGLKRLLMSWYYAGFYTGLHEGQQKQQSLQKPA